MFCPGLRSAVFGLSFVFGGLVAAAVPLADGGVKTELDTLTVALIVLGAVFMDFGSCIVNLGLRILLPSLVANGEVFCPCGGFTGTFGVKVAACCGCWTCAAGAVGRADDGRAGTVCIFFGSAFFSSLFLLLVFVLNWKTSLFSIGFNSCCSK